MSARLGKNCDRYVIIPNSRRTAGTSEGLGICMIARTFFGSGFSPSADRRCPEYETSGSRNLNFSKLSLMFFSQHRVNSHITLRSWSAIASALVHLHQQ